MASGSIVYNVRDNPPWVSILVKKYCGQLQSVGMPMPKMKSGCIIDKEYGTGHYGSVFPTDKHGTVFKVTSDEDEAFFVANYFTFKNKPEGIMRYYAIYALPEKHRGRNVYVLWREEAVEVGLTKYAGLTYDEKETQTLIKRYKDIAHEARMISEKALKKFNGGTTEYWSWMQSQLNLSDRMADEFAEHYGEEAPSDDNRYNGVTAAILRRHKGDRNRFAWLIESCAKISEEMENANGLVYLVGGALSEYQEQGLLLADVHLNNVGFVEGRQDYSGRILVITDPGHAVNLNPALSHVEIPTL
jgi:hypothetical protein